MSPTRLRWLPVSARARALLRWSVPLVCLAAVGLPRTAAAADPPVVALELSTTGAVPPRARDILEQRFHLGLKACGLRVVARDANRPEDQVTSSACGTECRRKIASRLQAQYVAGGTVAVRFDNYDMHLWLADGYSGKPVAEVSRRCDVCGIQAAAETMDLVASALRAKLEATRAQAAPIEIVTDPPGAQLTLDGDVVGPAPQSIQLPAGTHVIAARADGYLPAERQLTAVAGVSERVELRLLHAPPPTHRWRRIAGWTALGLGAAAVATGAALVAIDGNRTDCTSSDGGVVAKVCSTHDTATGGWVAVGLGGAAIGSGLYLLFTGRAHREPAQPVSVSLAPWTSGAKLSVQASF